MPNLYWIDIETTGLDPHKHDILEICIYRAHLSRPFDVESTPLFHQVLAHDGLVAVDDFVREMHKKKCALWLAQGSWTAPVVGP